MKVAFIQPYYQNVWESIGLGYIISYIKKHYKGTLEIKFYQGNFDSDEDIIKGCKDCNIVGFSCTTPVFSKAVKLSKAIKKINKNVWAVFGGWHVTALKEHSFEDGIDQIVLGEGEYAMLSIINGNRDRIVTGIKIGFQDLPHPDREVIKNERLVDLAEQLTGKRITSFQANRVCPVNCIFCAERIVTGRFNRSTNPIRSRDPKDVCDEIEKVTKQYNLNYFKFVDATFDVSPEYVINFCKEKINRGNTTEWECLIHAGFCTEEMFKWLKASNCNQINVGVESGSDKVLKEVRKGTRINTVKNVFEWGRKYGIERRGFFILGMPSETEDDILLTEKLLQEIDPDVLGFTILCPYPGSDLYNHEKYKDLDWEDVDEYSNDFWYTEHLTNKQLHKWQEYFHIKYKNKLCERMQIINE